MADICDQCRAISYEISVPPKGGLDGCFLATLLPSCDCLYIDRLMGTPLLTLNALTGQWLEGVNLVRGNKTEKLLNQRLLALLTEHGEWVLGYPDLRVLGLSLWEFMCLSGFLGGQTNLRIRRKIDFGM